MATELPLYGREEMKSHVVEGFAAVAEKYDVDGTEFFQQVGRWLVEAAQLPAEAWVLDVGCGKGAVSIPAARAVGPRGHVTAVDLAEPMLAHTAARAHEAGLRNVSTRLADAEDLPWPPESFEVVLAANVLQFLPRPVQAVRHWRELLVRGGIAGVAWTLAQDARWAPVIAAVDAHVPDGVPGFGAFMRRRPFNATDAMSHLFAAAGYQQVTTTTREITVSYRGPEQWWATYQSQGPWALSWRHIPAARLAEAQREATRLLDRMRDADGSLSRTLTFAFTVGHAPASSAGNQP